MATGGSSRVKAVLSDSDFQRELIAVGDKLIVVDFFATWSVDWCMIYMTVCSQRCRGL